MICSSVHPCAFDMHMGADMISQAEDGGEVEVDGKAGKGGHVRLVVFSSSYL